MRERDITARIDRIGLFAALPDLQMQVVAGGHPRASDLPDALPDTDRFTFPYKDPAHVRVQGGVSTPMADMDGPAVTRTVAGGDHPAVSGRIYRLAIRGRQVHPLMEYSPTLKGMDPVSESGGHPVAGTPAVKGKQDRIVRQDGDRPPQPSFLRSFPRFPDMPV